MVHFLRRQERANKFSSQLHRLLLVIAILGTIALSNSTVHAQKADEGRVFSLEECFRTAEQNNPSIQLADVQIEGAEAGVEAAFGQYLPDISASAGYSRILNSESVFSPGGGVIIRAPVERPNNFSLGVNAFYNVFDGFARERNYDAAKDNVRSLEMSAQNQRRQVMANIAQQFFTVLLNQETVQIRKENLEAQRKEVERSKALVEAGSAPITVQYTQEAEEGARELLLAQAENALAISKTTLLTTMGLAPDSEAEFTASSLPTEFSLAEMEAFRRDFGNLQTMLNKAYDTRPDLRSAEYAINAAEAQTSAARSGYLPNVTFSAGWNWRNFELALFDAGNSFVGINLNIPIFDRFITNRQVENARVSVMQAQTQRVQLQQQAAAEIQRAYLTLLAAEKEIDITNRSLRSAELNFRSLKERFDVGASTVIELINANMQLVNSKINKVSSHYNYLSARYQLLYALAQQR